MSSCDSERRERRLALRLRVRRWMPAGHDAAAPSSTPPLVALRIAPAHALPARSRTEAWILPVKLDLCAWLLSTPSRERA